MSFSIEEHKTATAVGYYYSDHYTPEEFLSRIDSELYEVGIEESQSHQPYRTGKELKITITVERTS